MQFKYFRSPSGDVYAYDIDDETQIPYMNQAVDSTWVDITDSWPPETIPTLAPVEVKPTIEDLHEQLLKLQEQIKDLSNAK
jgi:hypothetical protein